MTISKLRSRLYKAAKLLGDVQAVKKGRYVQRYKQRKVGAWTRRALNKVLK